MKYYYNTEIDEIESVDTIRSDYYDLFGQDYETFDEYLACCMTYNNGVLIDVSDRLREVKQELNRKLALARKYGMDEYEDEIINLMADMDRLSKANRASR